MDVKTVKRRAIRGAFSLTIRRVALWAITVITQVIFLPKILPVEIVGIFNIANSILIFFLYQETPEAQWLKKYNTNESLLLFIILI